jgi:hypothetical protein
MPAVERFVELVYLDKAESTSNVGFYVDEASLDAENATGLGVISALAGAVDLISLASRTTRKTTVARNRSFVIPTDDAAYNGNKLTVYLKDLVTFDKFHVSIPAVDPASYNTLQGTKNVILLVADGGTTQIEGLVTAIEATGILSKNGNQMQVLKIVKSSAKQGG